MGKKELSNRPNWQKNSGPKGELAESKFDIAFLREFSGTDFEIRPKPEELRDIYSKFPKHGIFVDYAITNNKTKKTLYVEIKSQKGWVEGKTTPSVGRGNVHERSCKYFAPGLLKIMRKKGNLNKNILPFWVVFQGDIASDKKRFREITFWFDSYNSHVFFWKRPSDIKSLINHFNKHLRSFLE